MLTSGEFVDDAELRSLVGHVLFIGRRLEPVQVDTLQQVRHLCQQTADTL